jgi:hypothetical protein
MRDIRDKISIALDTVGLLHSERITKIENIFRSELSAAKKAEAATVEKVRRLVVAARAVIDDRNNVALRGHDNLQAALSEVEALIGTPQQSKGG